MNNYEKYVTEVNNIFSILEQLKKGWNNEDNLNFIEDINEYKDSVIKTATFLQKQNNKETDNVKEEIK